MATSVFNRRWAAVLLEALTRHGVRHVCIAPGSRSTPLTLAAAANAQFICHTHFDERGLGHLALGLAKASGEPVAVIVTSGTAVANLYPAMIEAGLTGERLVLLTADRPPELIDCGANQAIRQQGIFASHARQTLDLPRPTPDIPARWLVSAIDSAMAGLDYGALHVNCPFAEPLYGDDEGGDDPWSQALGDWWQSGAPWLRETPRNTVPVMKQPDWFLWRQKRGVVVAGRMTAEEGVRVARWAQELGWPLLGDVLSQTGQPLSCADLWLARDDARDTLAQAQIVVQFGNSLTGKRLLQWQAACAPQEYWLIDPLDGRRDPAHHAGRRLVARVADWLETHPAQPRAGWAPELTELAARTRQCTQTYLASRFGEAQAAQRLPVLLPDNGQLFVGNSLIVRLIDAFAQLPAGYPVYSNRGASGIDGLISTLAGVQRATAKPTLAIVGDLSALYDLNALALLRHVSAPTVLIVVNNNGGAIFSMLPTPAAERERFYLMPQNVEFRHAAAMFSLGYACPQSWDELEQSVAQAWGRTGTTLIELQVPPAEGAETLQTLLKKVNTL
ncbi:2-succinyl-5-enolpyruvyl-6-hydroxy-3-cyclohexene-1-carboxylic-acid synthase [Enterobacillus tribolii]|uniref:2-succinyl-5-enolpyruvyl-6-hydroxy-3-cyclohexene-1-carboxylate synthase n=1 Tax=Enterobacillus tribolii TaxID=1487935 RepID=A0A370R2F2_9GAMM|nr:2-succinyl-5-enolpyruvyl-6-hydroxy-3-cyclohexene-1-carboxylic-acid synthase [Enterobacillus tribolii]MBW7983680.1 2-succinyl-5-enolpyruvyl-6-hydroxy-3-cyclohexene-1-carboxylic-acid synthase [Enterobacillus tribolii]RDK96610.1 2-succinyl-5-enolpyruvyl-6-hydroxy-3-cyclohexene-1-carboxylate synthase [Enterobacillus tribolii]